MLLAALLLTGCSLTPKPAFEDLSGAVERIGFIPAPRGAVLGVGAWLPGQERVVVSYRPPGGELADAHIYTVAAYDPELRLVPLPNDPSCARTGHVVPGMLADGRLAYVQRCIGNPRVPQEANSLMVFDFASGTATPLFPYYLHANQVQYALAPDLRRGVISDGRGLHERLLWLEPAGTRPVPDLAFERVWGPTWSPDGRMIAVAAVASGNGAQGLARLDLPWGLYVLDGQASRPRLLLDGFSSLASFAWSPDGRWLLGSGTRGNDGASGLWLVEVASGRASLVVAGTEQAGGAVWLPDGRTIVVSVGVRSGEPLVVPGRTPAERVGLAILKLPQLR